MALNLKTLGTRTLSGAVFVLLLLGSVLWSYASFTLFFFVVSLIALSEFYKISEKLGYKPYKVAGFIGAVFLYLVFVVKHFALLPLLLMLPQQLKLLTILIPITVFTIALFSRSDKPIQTSFFTIGGLLYAVLPFALMQEVVWQPGSGAVVYNPSVLLGVIFLIWSNDTFAYLGGSLFGKNKMIERISPGKTWEGTVFGVLVSFGISFLLRTFLDNSWFWPLFGLAVPVLATLGDLVESMLKRQAGVKDSGSIMPGHGGALDRFDSLIFVTPFVYVFLALLKAY